MSILTNCYIKENNNFVTRDIAGETIIVPVRSSASDLDSIYTLNELGTKIWKLIDGRTSVQQIIDTLCKEYDVATEVAKKDVEEFLHSIEVAGLIRPC
jgi:hypothetical protein